MLVGRDHQSPQAVLQQVTSDNFLFAELGSDNSSHVASETATSRGITTA